jgi:hypothetical protein
MAEDLCQALLSASEGPTNGRPRCPAAAHAASSSASAAAVRSAGAADTARLLSLHAAVIQGRLHSQLSHYKPNDHHKTATVQSL